MFSSLRPIVSCFRLLQLSCGCRVVLSQAGLVIQSAMDGSNYCCGLFEPHIAVCLNCCYNVDCAWSIIRVLLMVCWPRNPTAIVCHTTTQIVYCCDTIVCVDYFCCCAVVDTEYKVAPNFLRHRAMYGNFSIIIRLL